MMPLKNLLLILAFAFYGFIQAQEPTVTITLTVDTDLLGDDRRSPGGCTFTVVPKDKVVVNDPNDPKTFTIMVDSTDVIEWQGISTSGEAVKIKRITFISGTNIIGSQFVKGNRSNGKEMVKVKPNRNTPSDKDFEYGIRFKTKADIFFYYEIDPKIKVGNQ
jgi:hypothetical protein